LVALGEIRVATEAAVSSEVESIERTYRAYFTVFQMANPRAITPYYQIPCMFISPAGAFALASTQEAEQFFERLIYSLRARGYVRSVLEDVQVKQLSEELALVNVRGARFKNDRELLERLHGIYTMRKTDGVWRIVVATMFDSSHTLDLA
jgi:ketosteroid isomerase-like protein